MDGVHDRIVLSYDRYGSILMTGEIKVDACVLHDEQRSKTMTNSKVIVMWGSEDILSSSIEHFLSAKADWKVVSISNKEDLETLILAVEPTQPDIVIIHQGCHNKPTDLPLQFLQDRAVIKVIRVSLEDNLMDVYSKQKILVTQASDLITVIENESQSLAGGENQSW